MMMMNPKKKTIQLRRTIVHYWEHSTNKKPTLILVHGITGSHEGFQYMVPLLADYHLIVPDLPGFGVSPLPHDNLTLVELGTLLADFIEALHLKDKPFILGHSMGSLVVAETLAQQPKLVHHKVIFASPVPTPIGRLDARRPGAMLTKGYYTLSRIIPRLSKSKIITRLSTKVMITTKDKTLKRAIYEHHYGNLNYISSIAWYSRLYKEVNSKGMSDYKTTLSAFDVLVVSGERDMVTPLKHQKKAAAALATRLEIIPGVGHLAHYERPQELVAAIKNFLQ